jgi:RNA polymerase sigma factor (sigma-70 family)
MLRTEEHGVDGGTRSLESDPQLLRAFKRGEASALAAVLDMYAPVVAAVIRKGIAFEANGERMRIGHDLLEHEVEIAVGDTFSRAFSQTARDGYDGIRPFRAWLLAITRNLLIDAARDRKRRGMQVSIDVVEPVAGPDADPEIQLEERELCALVEQFADGLGEPDRTIYKLRYTDGRTHKETGQALAMTEIQIRRKDAHLRDSLLTFLRKHGFLVHHDVSFGTSLLGRKSP